MAYRAIALITVMIANDGLESSRGALNAFQTGVEEPPARRHIRFVSGMISLFACASSDIVAKGRAGGFGWAGRTFAVRRGRAGGTLVVADRALIAFLTGGLVDCVGERFCWTCLTDRWCRTCAGFFDVRAYRTGGTGGADCVGHVRRVEVGWTSTTVGVSGLDHAVCLVRQNVAHDSLYCVVVEPLVEHVGTGD